MSRAAVELGVSPGAVTQQIHALQKYLKVRLVQRSGRGIELTSWGILYLQRVGGGLELLRSAASEVERARRSSHLTISAIPSLSAKWLGPLLFAWNARHPAASASLDANDAEPQVEAGEVDFRVSYGIRRRAHQRYVRLFTDYVLVVASPAFIAANAPVLQPRDLLKRPLLWTDWGPEYAALPNWNDWFKHLGVITRHARPGLTFASSSATVDAAIEGHGFALAQHSMVASALASRNLVTVFSQVLPLPDDYFVAWNSATLDKPIGAAFHQWLIKEARRFDYQGSVTGR